MGSLLEDTVTTGDGARQDVLPKNPTCKSHSHRDRHGMLVEPSSRHCVTMKQDMLGTDVRPSDPESAVNQEPPGGLIQGRVWSVPSRGPQAALRTPRLHTENAQASGPAVPFRSTECPLRPPGAPSWVTPSPRGPGVSQDSRVGRMNQHGMDIF